MPDSPEGAARPSPDRDLERAYDEFLEAALRGEAEDLDAFCARHGDGSGDLRRWIESLLGLLPGAAAEPAEARARLEAEPGLPFERIGDFRLVRRLGAGGMGIVYLAEQESLGRLVALKLIRPEHAGTADAEARFRREARAIAKLRHPNIVTVFATGEEPGALYFAMELVPGRGLDEVLREAEGRGERVPVPRALRWAAQIARALAAAHEAGLVHRDVKPSNVRITPDDRALLLDFGLAREAGESALTGTREFRGTTAYASPEQVSSRRGSIDARTDVHALGVTLYEALTGELPFRGETTEQVFQAILTKEPVPPRRRNPSIPRDVETVVLAALEKDPARRYATAAAFAEDLDALLGVRPIRARPAGPVTRAAKLVRRNPVSAFAVGALLLAVLAIGAAAVRRNLAFRGHLASARGWLERGEPARARAAVEQARAIDPQDGDARDLLDRVAAEENRRACRRALAEFRVGLAREDELRAAIVPVRERIAAAESKREAAYMTREEGAAYHADLDALEELRREAEETRLSVFEHVRRAERADPGNPEVATAFADLFVREWREARASKNAASEAALRERVARYDRGVGRYAEELAGTGSISIAGAPAGAEIYAFRYESRSRFRPGGERRLVPAPWSPADRAVGEANDAGPRPGDVVAVVDAVESGSPAERAGLRIGDLLLGLAGAPIEGSVFALDVVAGGPAATAGVRRFDALTRFAGRDVREIRDLEYAWRAMPAGQSYEALFVRGGRESRLEARKGNSPDQELGCLSWTPVGHFAMRLPWSREPLRVYSGGKTRELSFEESEWPGLRLSASAYPLFFSEANRIGRLPIPAFAAPPGSYLFVARAEGFDDARCPVDLPPGAAVVARVEMFRAGSGPPGFVRVPAGPFLAGGDPEAPRSWERGVREVGGFWLARREVTQSEYAEFLNDPETIAAIEASEREGPLVRVPRGGRSPGGDWKREGGRYAVRADLDRPILGIDWEDAQAFCRWMTKRARERGEPWEYGLPTEEEWEKAARGVDGRIFPWGDTFDWHFAKGGRSRPEEIQPEACARFLGDESPWGARDLSGCASEWCAPGPDATEGGLAPLRGGAWSRSQVEAFRAAYRTSVSRRNATSSIGFRLVARD